MLIGIKVWSKLSKVLIRHSSFRVRLLMLYLMILFFEFIMIHSLSFFSLLILCKISFYSCKVLISLWISVTSLDNDLISTLFSWGLLRLLRWSIWSWILSYISLLCIRLQNITTCIIIFYWPLSNLLSLRFGFGFWACKCWFSFYFQMIRTFWYRTILINWILLQYISIWVF